MKPNTLIVAALLACGALQATAQQLAFPGAQGWGRHATGGRTGSVYHVTNLNDSGTGSLRDAVSQSNRIIVFDVAGVIRINSRLVFKNNLYVAGQTAPGEGITVYGNGVSFSGADNIIVRYMRFRMGKVGDSGKDAAGIANGQHMIFDHCSFSWGLDENFSINPDGKGKNPEMITLSNCIIGQGLMTHSAGGLMQSDSITLYRNLYVDNSTRNNKVKGTNQYVNNIVYNWKNAAYNMGGDSEGDSYCNIESNLFINGPAKGGAAFTGGNTNFHFYGDDNWQDSNLDGKLEPTLVTSYSGADRQDAPYDYPELEKWPGHVLADSLLPTVGASLPYRDYADCYMLDEVKSFGTEGALIYDEKSLVYGAPNTWTLWGGNTKVDTDGDGMPDAWETAHGTDPTKDDAMTIAANGYANIENYINSITRADRDYFLRAPLCLSVESSTQSSVTLSWLDYSDNEKGFVVEMEKGGAFTEVARTAANVSSCTVTDETMKPGTAYNFRVRAFDGDNYSEYSNTITGKTRPEAADLVDIATYQPDVTWAGAEGDKWTAGSTCWLEGKTYADGQQVLFAPTAAANVEIPDTVKPKTVVVDGEADLAFTGDGAIGGETSLNKAGEGTLTLSGKHAYTGATVLHEGKLSFATIANGGVSSSIGASQEFAQNWILAGGTYEYTGGNASTNRALRLDGDGTLAIANSGSTLKMSGSLEGMGDLTLDGKGTLSVESTTFFNLDGDLYMKGGKMLLNGEAVCKAGLGNIGKVVMCGGTFATSSGNDKNPTYSFPLVAEDGTYSYVSFFRNCIVNSKVSGSGTLEWEVNWVREYLQGNWDDFTGTVVVNGTGKAANSQFALYNGTGIKNGTLYLKGTAQVVCKKNQSTYYLGGLSGDANTYLSGFDVKNAGSGTWIVGTANTDETFKGIIDDRAQGGKAGKTSIVKEGNGIWRLTGANTYSGTTQVRRGTLTVNGKPTGTGAITVNNGGTLNGKGTLASAVTINNGGIIQGGDTLTDGSKLQLTKTLTLASGATLNVPVSGTKTNTLTVVGKITLSDGAILTLGSGELDTTPEAGTVYKVFTGTPNVSGTFTTILPAKPGEGLTWDTTELYTAGTLKVITDEAAGITSPESIAPARTIYYNVGGTQSQGEVKGLNIIRTTTEDGKTVVRKVMR